MFTKYIDNLRQQGLCYFILKDAQKTLNKPIGAIRSSIAHLVAKQQLIRIVNGFYVIIPPELKPLGCITVEQFIHPLMEYLGYNYYVGLLTAAMYHGASHQSPHIFQVMISQKRPAILQCGKFEIHFVIKKDLATALVEKRITQKGLFNLCSTESIMFDLLLYPKVSGGLNHIATILTELKDAVNSRVFANAVESNPNAAHKQRLGYLLELVGAKSLANILYSSISRQQRLPYVPLSPNRHTQNELKRNQKWRIIENVKIESDI